MIQIIDREEPEYLDGAMMQFSVERGEYPASDTLAYCISIEVARALAHALAEADEPIVIRQV